MALMQTMSWDALEAALDEEGGTSLTNLRRASSIRRIISRLRSDEFPYPVYPATHGEGFMVSATDLYNFSTPPLLTVMQFELECPDHDPLYRVTYIGWNDRIGAQEERTWRMGESQLEQQLPKLFSETKWPRRSRADG